VDVEIPVETMLDRGLTGDALGGAVMEEIPVLAGLALVPRPIWLKHVGAAASSGGAEMYHVPGLTPEADSLEEATGGARARPSDGAAERRAAWEAPNGADRQEDVTFVMPGCPPASAGQMGRIADLPEGRRIHDGVALWVRTPRQIRHLRDESGVTDAIERAGARLMSDGCPAIDRMMPKGTRAIAADSCKQAHCLPAITGHGTWGASLEDCVETALTGRFPGRLQ
jgi:hypothetical protein